MHTSKQPAPYSEPRLGIWHSMYHYPSSTRIGMFEGEHFVRLQKAGKQWVLESLPNVNKSYLLVRLVVEDSVATGTWQEQTDPSGYYKGVVYHGVLQMVVSDEGRHMQGKWLGFSNDKQINVGAWEFTFVGKKLPAQADKQTDQQTDAHIDAPADGQK